MCWTSFSPDWDMFHEQIPPPPLWSQPLQPFSQCPPGILTPRVSFTDPPGALLRGIITSWLFCRLSQLLQGKLRHSSSLCRNDSFLRRRCILDKVDKGNNNEKARQFPRLYDGDLPSNIQIGLLSWWALREGGRKERWMTGGGDAAWEGSWDSGALWGSPSRLALMQLYKFYWYMHLV